MEQNQNPQNSQPQFRCPGNCLQCQPAQRQYCASQHAYSNMLVLDKVMEVLAGLQASVAKMQGTIQELSTKIEAIQNSEAAVFDTGELFPKEFAKDVAAG